MVAPNRPEPPEEAILTIDLSTVRPDHRVRFVETVQDLLGRALDLKFAPVAAVCVVPGATEPDGTAYHLLFPDSLPARGRVLIMTSLIELCAKGLKLMADRGHQVPTVELLTDLVRGAANSDLVVAPDPNSRLLEQLLLDGYTPVAVTGVKQTGTVAQFRTHIDPDADAAQQGMIGRTLAEVASQLLAGPDGARGGP